MRLADPVSEADLAAALTEADDAGTPDPTIERIQAAIADPTLRGDNWRVDTLLISAEDWAVARRRPSRRRTRYPASEVDFVGTLDAAVRLLLDDRTS
jgi:hypothetical protein